MSNNAGVKLKHPVKARDDADVVKRVRIAGGIPLLVSNTPELCMCWETFNNVTGTSWNPYDTRRTPGGSSGGEVSIILNLYFIYQIYSRKFSKIKIYLKKIK